MDCCRQYDEDIWAAAEAGQVPDQLARHLKKCKSCAREMQTAASATAGFRVFRRVQAPSLSLSLPVDVHSRARRPGRLILVGPAATLGLVLLVCLTTRVLFVRGGIPSHSVAVRNTPPSPGQPEITKPDSVPHRAAGKTDTEIANRRSAPNAVATAKRDRLGLIRRAVPQAASRRRPEVSSAPAVPVAPKQPDRGCMTAPVARKPSVSDMDVGSSEHGIDMTANPQDEVYVIGLVGVDTGDPDDASYPIGEISPIAEKSVNL